MALNLRRGFLRLWAGLSLVWLIAAVAFMAGGVVDELRREEFLRKLHALEPAKAGVPCSVAESSGVEVAWERVSNLLSNGLNFCIAEVEQIRAISPTYTAVDPEELMRRLDDRTRTWPKWPLLNAALWAAGPPTALLLLGLLVAWIAAGFANRRDIDAT